MFFHRWSENNVDMSRVYVADSDTGRNIVGLPNNGFYSHYWWKDNQTLTIWTLPKAQETASVKGISKLKRLRWLTRVLIPVYAVVKPLLGKRVQNAISPQSELRDFCALTGVEQSSRYLVSGNGHQSWFKDNTRLLNDTYQDSDGYRELMILDCEKGDAKQLGKFYSTYNDCVFRCDLHPRLNADDSKVTIDSAHGKKRKVLVLEGI